MVHSIFIWAPERECLRRKLLWYFDIFPPPLEVHEENIVPSYLKPKWKGFCTHTHKHTHLRELLFALGAWRRPHLSLKKSKGEWLNGPRWTVLAPTEGTKIPLVGAKTGRKERVVWNTGREASPSSKELQLMFTVGQVFLGTIKESRERMCSSSPKDRATPTEKRADASSQGLDKHNFSGPALLSRCPSCSPGGARNPSWKKESCGPVKQRRNNHAPLSPS